MTKIGGVKLYNLLDTAKELDLSPQTIRNYVRDGKIKYLRIGKNIVITDKHIKDFKKAKK